jgi:hypothetical protein
MALSQPTVYVIATDVDGTRAALETAIPLARGSRCALAVLVPQVVPRPLAVDAPADSTAFTVRRYRDLVRALGGDAHVRLCLCRRVEDVIHQMLPAKATVVVGGEAGTWLVTRDEGLVRRLSHLGHHVVFAPIEHATTGD